MLVIILPPFPQNTRNRFRLGDSTSDGQCFELSGAGLLRLAPRRPVAGGDRLRLRRAGGHFRPAQTLGPMRLARTEGELRQCLETQQLLLRRDTGLRTILKHTNSIFFMLDRDSRVLHSEGKGLERIKRPAGGSVGMRFLEAHPTRTDLQQHFDKSLNGETVVAYVPFSGGTFQLLVSPLKAEDGEVKGLAGILLDVTERENARARVAESEAMLRSILDNAPYSMVVQRISDGKCLEANRAFLTAMGITQEDLAQFDAGVLTELSPDEALALRRRIVEQGGLHGQETVFRRPNGSTRQLLYSSVPITYAGEPSLLSMTMDITARQQALRAKAESEERLRAIFNNSPLGIFRSSFEGGTEEANPELVRMLGYADREELLGVGPRNLYADPAERDQIRQLLLESPSGVRREIMLRRKDGGLLPVIVSASLQFDATGRPAWIHGVLEDLSARKEQERALEFWTQRFEIVNMAAQHIFYDYHLPTGAMQWVGAVREVLGYDRQTWTGQ
jgi:PAS domain S-box-containing protein